MKNLFFLTILTFLLVGLYSCQKDEVEPSSLTKANETKEVAAVRANATVPFKGVYDVELGEEISPPPLWIVPLYGVGISKHLGKSTWESTTTLYDLDFNQPPPYPQGWIQDGDMTFTAADGSQLFGFFTGYFYGTGGSGTYEITDGNGRFEGAYTSPDCDCTYFWINIEDAPNYLEFNGTLTNP